MKQPKPEQYHEKKRHTEDQFPYNTYLCTIPDDFAEVPVHWHEEAELIVIQKGSGTVLVDLTHYHVTAGDIIIVLPEHLHAIREISGQKMEYENIIFRPELLSSDNHDVCFEKFLYPLFSGQIHTVVHIHPRLSYYPKIHDLIRTMDQLCSKKPAGYQLALKGSLFLFIFQLLSLDEKKNYPTYSNGHWTS
jgi:mannose-6-phosphate isomerase-like protein (cupin superfamily)|nr:AraC family ligand binding domain-containing protein [Eubacterium ramulus]